MGKAKEVYDAPSHTKLTRFEDKLIITGDYYNWIFCRPFTPDKDGSVSEMYWIEKLQIANEAVEKLGISMNTAKIYLSKYIKGKLCKLS